jgi:hypothetical protein
MTEPVAKEPRADEPPLPDKVTAIDEALAKAKIPHAFGGALALAYYTVPRATIDVDVNAFVGTNRRYEVLKTLEAIGIAIDLDGATVERDGQCRLWWGRNPVDLFFSYDPFHREMRKETRRAPFGGTTIPILAPEHLVVCKAVFNRRKDWLDIEQMLIAADELDVEAIEGWLERMVGSDDRRLERLAELRSG